MSFQEEAVTKRHEHAGPKEEPHTRLCLDLWETYKPLHSLSPNSIHFTNILCALVLSATEMQSKEVGEGDIQNR